MTTPESTEPPDDQQWPSGSGEAGSGRPDWLVGAEEGLAAEYVPSVGVEPAPVIRPVPRQADPPESDRGMSPPQSEPPKSWAAAGTSVPKLTVVPRRERPAAGRPVPDDSSEPSAPEDGLGPGEGTPEPAPASATVRPPEEPLWLVWTETLASSHALQLGILAGVVAVATFALWPRQDRGVALREIRQHPERFEGQTVTVQGKVGEVFDIGSGHVFHLVQGRDTVVVFSSDRRPASHARVRVAGNVSTGYLDGTPRVAIFERPGTSSPR